MAGGRGKGTFSSGLKGGVKVTRDLDSVTELARQMINYQLVTKQTPKDGVKVRKVYVLTHNIPLSFLLCLSVCLYSPI